MNILRIARPAAVFTKPVHVVGTDAAHKMTVNVTLAPCLSQKGLNKNLVPTSLATAVILLVQT